MPRAFHPGPFLLLLLIASSGALRAQNIGINANGATPNVSAMLDIDVSGITGTKRGLLIPRMTTAERNAIPGPATGLLVYDTTTNAFWYFNGSSWVQLLTAGGAGWGLAGNGGTVAGTNFIGTTDNVPFEVRANGQRSGWVQTGPYFATDNTAWGYQALASNTTGRGNAAVGFQALAANTGGSLNTAVGLRTLWNNTIGSDNVACGFQALMSNTTGNNNTAIGVQSLTLNTTGTQNTASGLNALYANATGNGNTANGCGSLAGNTNGNGNTGVGNASLASNTTGSSNSAIGNSALLSNISGSNNTAAGAYALQMNTTASANSAFGYQALRANVSGTDNAAFGINGLAANTTGSENTAAGADALAANTSGTANTALGRLALNANISGGNNTGVGSRALALNTAANNTALGAYALGANTSGSANTGGGYYSLGTCTTGYNNTAYGYSSMSSATTAFNNVGIGMYALHDLVSGDENTAVGINALFGVTSGVYNTAVGQDGAWHTTTGTYNTALGVAALATNVNGNDNTAVGFQADVSAPNLYNATAIGSFAVAGRSNCVVLGGTGGSAVNVGIGTSNPALAGLQVERMVNNTTAIFRGGTNSQGIGLVADWPGLYLNCYYNGVGVTTMAGTGYPAVINSNQSNGGIIFQTTTTANTAPDALVTVPERMRISGNGNVGIGTTGPNYLLEVNGSAAKPGGGSWTASSDARLKTNVQNYTDGLAQLLRIRPVRFHYNTLSGHDTRPEYVGVIAQELQPVAPYMVGSFQRDSVTYLNVDNSAMVYMLINSVKEQQAEIEELKQRVRELEAGPADRARGMGVGVR